MNIIFSLWYPWTNNVKNHAKLSESVISLFLHIGHLQPAIREQSNCFGFTFQAVWGLPVYQSFEEQDTLNMTPLTHNTFQLNYAIQPIVVFNAARYAIHF